ncbi:MAG: hypothetical protein ABI581_08370 [Sediminibacterium sp.]
MFKIIPVILLCFLLNDLSAQTYNGTWNGAGYYAPGQPMTTIMQKMGGKKLIYLDISPSNTVTGSMVVTYDNAKASITNNGGDQVFTIGGKLDVNKQLLLLVLTHLKMGSIEMGFQRPDSIFYSVELLKKENKLVMAAGAGKNNNRNSTEEWVGSSQGQGMGMNILDNLSMHLLPINIQLENTYSPPPAAKSATTSGAPGVSPSPNPFSTALPDISVVRKIEIQRTIVLDTNLIKLDLYDNGEVDGDIATIILDGKVVLDKKLMSTTAASLSLDLSKGVSEHILELFANNLGSIPPNTALLVLTCNRKRYEINLSSNGTVNGSVKLVFKSN